MTPKEQYEARKAERIARRRVHPQQGPVSYQSKDEAIEDMLDRLVTAMERIADALSEHDGRQK